MCHAQRDALLLRAVHDLKQAARVAGGHHLTLLGANVLHLAFEKFARHFRLREVVDAGRASARCGVVVRSEPKARDLRQKPPRRGLDEEASPRGLKYWRFPPDYAERVKKLFIAPAPAAAPSAPAK